MSDLLYWDDKDKDDILEYYVDWADPALPRLSPGETILTSAFTNSDGYVNINAQSIDGTKSVVWLSGGVIGKTALLNCRITTSFNRQQDQSVALHIIER